METDLAGGAPFVVVESKPEKKELLPVYSAICTDTKKGNLTCSGVNQFCFLCNYCDTSDCEVDLRAHLHELADTGSELFSIARAAHSIYNQTIRPTLVHTDENGNQHRSPEWPISSIKRHLLLSGEFESIFSSYEKFVMKSMIIRQADELLDDCGSVDEGKAKTLLASIKQFSEYRKTAAGPAAKKQRLAINSTPS